MSLSQIFIGFIGLVMAIGTFCLMRFPRFRRPQFREYGAFSLLDSVLGGLSVLVLIALMILIQGLSEE